jgi:hypothetical protein
LIGGTNCVGSWLVTVTYVNGEAIESLVTTIRSSINKKSGDLDLHDIIKIKTETKQTPGRKNSTLS